MIRTRKVIGNSEGSVRTGDDEMKEVSRTGRRSCYIYAHAACAHEIEREPHTHPPAHKDV